MSNIGSSALQSSKQHTQKTPQVPGYSIKQKQFNQGTMNLLDEARNVVEQAVSQGQEINPMIYQMLGLQPKVIDHSGDLQAAQQEADAAQKQWDEAQQTVAKIKGIPKGKRSPAQKKQLRQLKSQMPDLNAALGKATDAMGRLKTMPKTITGFERMDPSQIPPESPFSAANPLHQAQATEADRLNQYLAGGEVDPTLKHQYDAAESALRAKLAQRFGPDFEGTSVGQMALQNFSRQKNEAFATYNQQQVEKYNNLAFQGQANLQNLLSNRIGMLREPGQSAINEGGALSNLATQRLSQQGTVNQWLLGHAGVGVNTSNPGMIPALAVGAGGSALKNLLAPGPVDSSTGQASPSLASQGWSGLKSGAGGLYNWATGAGAAEGAGAAGAAAGTGAAEAAGMTGAEGASMLV